MKTEKYFITKFLYPLLVGLILAWFTYDYLIKQNEDNGENEGEGIISGLFPKKSNPDFIFEGEPFVLECIECKQLRAKVVCEFEIVSPNRDAHISVYVNNDAHSKIIDENGNEYYASKVKLADKEGSWWVAKEMVKGVSIPAYFTFSTGDKKIKRITRMDIRFGEHNRSDLRLKLRDIPVRY